ncbi:MAG: FAD:protein FMN transferase [Balneolaceae bacterium]|nr:FAD:protein FMN transferase [Balneolaceae bacterium]
MSKTVHHSYYSMGTRFHLMLPGVDEDYGFRIFQKVKNELNRVEKKLSRFLPQSDIYRLNIAAKRHSAKVDGELFDILKACKLCHEITGGAFDPTLRPLYEYQQKMVGEFVPDQLFFDLKDQLGFDKVQLDEDNSVVRFGSHMLEIDLGGFGKGYALEKVKNILENSSVKSAFVSFGESSVLAFGNHPAGGFWKIGMNNYLKPGKTVAEFELSGGSVSTSSNFYLDDNGRLENHSHIINPKTGEIDSNQVAVSVSARSPLLAEMLSTAFLSMSDDEIEDVVNQYEEVSAAKADYSSGSPVITRYEKIEIAEDISV